MHDEHVVHEVEAVRLGLERVGHHLPHLVGVELGELVYVLAAREIVYCVIDSSSWKKEENDKSGVKKCNAGWSICSENAVCWHQIKTSAAV